MNKYLSRLASKCQGIACVISDGEKVQKECPENLKSVLLEASHALDSECVTVSWGVLQAGISNSRGAYRQLTIRERIAIKLLGGKTEVRV